MNSVSSRANVAKNAEKLLNILYYFLSKNPSPLKFSEEVIKIKIILKQFLKHQNNFKLFSQKSYIN